MYNHCMHLNYLNIGISLEYAVFKNIIQCTEKKISSHILVLGFYSMFKKQSCMKHFENLKTVLNRRDPMIYNLMI